MNEIPFSFRQKMSVKKGAKIEKMPIVWKELSGLGLGGAGTEDWAEDVSVTRIGESLTVWDTFKVIPFYPRVGKF